ncbi:MAG: leucine-rich repeat protein, partial [Lentisphaerae bacterium]|nr:leucine-rich repeat protein [Lentisphaerota bacterium]
MRAQTTLDAALNVPGGLLEFTTISTQDPPYLWTVVTEPESTHDGMSAARSGATGYYYSNGNYFRSILNTTLTGSGLLTFWAWKTGNGQLDFYVNGGFSQTIEYYSATGEEWRLYRVKLPLVDQNTVHWYFENRTIGSLPGQTDHYFLLDDVRWHPANEQGYVFQLNEDGASYSLLAYLGQDSEVTVPAQVEGKPVTIIGGNAFASSESLTSVILPEGLLRIEDGAFYNNWSLQSVSLPSTLQYIGESAFANCQELTQAALPSGLTELGHSAFYATGLEQIVFPPGLLVIPESAFSNCRSLRSVVIPATVQTIGASAFSWCGLTSIVFADRSGTDIILGEACFEYNPGLRECILPDGITTLPARMLAGDEMTFINLKAIRIPASVTSLGSLVFESCDEVVIFFMGSPPAVAEAGLASSPDSYDDALVVYQSEHQTAWAAVLDGEGLFHDYRTEVLSGEPIPLPEISTPGDKTSFIDSVTVTFTLHAPLPGDELLVEYSEDDGETIVPTILTPGASNGGFNALGSTQWTYSLTVTAGFRVHAIRPAAGGRAVPGYSRCSGSVDKDFLRWNDFADALDNHTLDFSLEDPEYWSVSTAQAMVGGSSVYVDLGGPEDNPPWTTQLRAQVTGPGLLSFWIYPDREDISVNFGEVDTTGEGWNGFKDDRLPRQNVADYYDNPKTWVKRSIAIPDGDFLVGWGFGGWGTGGAAYIDQIQFMSQEGNFGYVVNPDGVSATVMAFIDNQDPWMDPVPVDLIIPTTLGGLPVTAIGDYAFGGLTLQTLFIPPSVTVIGDYVFSGCSGLDEIVIPASVTTLGEGVFADYDDLRHVVFLGPRPAAAGGNLGGRAVILFAQGQPGWVDGGTYRGLPTVYVSGERVDEPGFSRGDIPPAAFPYFNQAFQLSMSGPEGLAIRYAVGGAVPTSASPGTLYSAPIELDDPTGDITVSARVFRGAEPCSGVTRVTFRNAKELSEILDCFDAIFVLRDPTKWQVIEETNDQDEVVNRYLQAGPYQEQAYEQAHLDIYMYYPEVPDKFSFQWRLVSDLPDPGFYDAGRWEFALENNGTWSNYEHRETWQTSNINVTTGGELTGTLLFGDLWATQPDICHLKLDRVVVGAPRAVPKVRIEPPGAGQVSYWSDRADPPGWQPFTGAERLLVDEWVQFKAEPAEGYMLAAWQRYDLDAGQYLQYNTNPEPYLQIRADEDGDQAENDYKAVFAPAVLVTVTLSEGGWWPWRGQEYAQDYYTQGRLALKDSMLKFWPQASNGYVFTGWNDGVTDIDRTVVCSQDIVLQGNFAKCINSAPYVNIVNTGDAGQIVFTSGEGVLTGLNPDGTITYTISVEYPDHYRFAGWQFDQGQVVAAQAEGDDLTVTLDWDQTKYFDPQARFYKQTLLAVRAAAGQKSRGLLQVRKSNADGEEIILDEDGNARVDIYSTVWIKATALGINRFDSWLQVYGPWDFTSSSSELAVYISDYPSYEFTASFVAQATLTLQLDPTANGTGTFLVNYQGYQPGMTFDIGSQVWFQVTPHPNNRFVKWLDNDSTWTSRTVYIEPGDNIYTARIVKTGTITMKAEIITTGEPGGGVTNVYTPDLGTDLTITA